jgi:hypothetical protein
MVATFSMRELSARPASGAPGLLPVIEGTG